jgi:hypothetical protein
MIEGASEVSLVLKALTDIEEEVYQLIKRAGELRAKDVPFKKAGVIPSLVKKGLVEVYKKPSAPGGRKKCKFLRCKRKDEEP